MTAALLANGPCRTVKENENVEDVVTTLDTFILNAGEVAVSSAQVGVLEIPEKEEQAGAANDCSSYTDLQLSKLT